MDFCLYLDCMEAPICRYDKLWRTPHTIVANASHDCGERLTQLWRTPHLLVTTERSADPEINTKQKGGYIKIGEV